MAPDNNNTLAHWLAIWHPRYRAILFQLFAAGVIASGLIYAQNYFLSLLTPVLSGDRSQVPAFLAVVVSPASAATPLAIVAFFALTGAAATFIGYWKAWATGRMRIASKNDLEQEIMQHLLHKDDAFLGRLSPAETVNRLSVDLTRVGMRRKAYMESWWMVLLLSGYLLFFFTRDWRMALVALVVMAMGGLWTVFMSRRIKAYDSVYLRQDDAVKARFEDCLKAAAEIQVSRLFSKAGRRLTAAQENRTTTFMHFVTLHALLDLGKMLAPVLAFVAMLAIVLHLRSGGQEAKALSLVPVVIWALPALFYNASEIVLYQLDMQLAKTSESRLLEYESRDKGTKADEASLRPDKPVAPEALRLDAVGYQYPAEGGGYQGGVENIKAVFEPRRWTAIVGGAGSGKSTLFNLITGRLKPQTGRITFGEKPMDKLDEQTQAALFSLMPQSPALFDDTLKNNLYFARHGAVPEVIDREHLAMIEEIGLGAVCRQKALDLTPDPAAAEPELEKNLAEVRKKLREAIAQECGVTISPFEEGRNDPRNWVLEGILAGRCDQQKSWEVLLDKRSQTLLTDPDETKILISLGKTLLAANRGLLEVTQYRAYRDLAPYPATEAVWSLRRECLEWADRDQAGEREKRGLCLVALTARPAEVWGEIDTEFWTGPGLGKRLPRTRSRLKKIVGDHCLPYSPDKKHPLLNWRDNLLFGFIADDWDRSRRHMDQVLIDHLVSMGMGDLLVRDSMSFRIGQRGAGLSGGQGQMTALGRALLRDAPILLLDEPTSALDPAGRSHLVEFLKKHRDRRTLITISHDPEFIRHADSILVLDQGRLAGQGAYEDLIAQNEVFRKTMRLA